MTERKRKVLVPTKAYSRQEQIVIESAGSMDAHSCLGDGHAEQSPDDIFIHPRLVSQVTTRQVGTGIPLQKPVIERFIYCQALYYVLPLILTTH